ncbi:DNA topoisomerase I [Candidatus Woesearchaeota archaeon]|nr:DNA topoisomerase I [Candidatus Woesearchaeota archaeon]
MHDLIITEKPSAAKKIAEALADGKPVVEKTNGVSVFKLSHKKKDIVVVSAVGHLYSLTEKQKSFTYPSYDIEWKPAADVDKGAAHSRKYLNIIKKEAKSANSFTVACDYDIEGEVIGLNVIRYTCNQKDASRMKFSTLTKPDLVKAYENKFKNIDWGQALAGETRHFLDWLYGINISRALTLAMKEAGRFKIMSSGRVQGPALKIIVDKEKEIKAFKPEPYWQITLLTEKDKKKIEALHKTEKFWKEEEATKIYEKVKNEKTTKIKDIQKRKFNQAPPTPFNLGDLQTEAYRLFKIQPKQTLQIAQNLYLAGVTSYPRTSSQQLPSELGYNKLLSTIAKNPIYKLAVEKLLAQKNNLKPNNGKKTDPAHPAIYPTGTMPKELKGQESKVYDLIVKRFISTFAEPAERETATIIFDIKEEEFIGKGTITTHKGWHDYYAPYVRLKEEEIPQFKIGEEAKTKKIILDQKETQPPKRYTPSSIITELEKRGLGTKATRADIVENLFKRGYVKDKSIEATEIGIEVEEILEKYVPELLDEEFTRNIEEEMELIRENKSTQNKILEKAKKHLDKILSHFKKQEGKVGEELVTANQEAQDSANTLGPCPECKQGTIMIKRGKFGMFAACNKYPDCKTTFNLPKNGATQPTDKISETGYPIIRVIRQGKSPIELSLNPEDNMKDIPEEKKEEMKQIKEGKSKKPCPECGKPLVVRTAIYGDFVACSGFPKCKYTEATTPQFKDKKSEENQEN